VIKKSINRLLIKYRVLASSHNSNYATTTEKLSKFFNFPFLENKKHLNDASRIQAFEHFRKGHVSKSSVNWGDTMTVDSFKLSISHSFRCEASVKHNGRIIQNKKQQGF
jgi:hypothetical protein